MRWGRSRNRHLPEEAGRREHPRLTSVTHGTRVEGTAGARQAPLPAQPGSGHSRPAERWGQVGGCRVVSNCFQTVFAASFFLNSEYNFFHFLFCTGVSPMNSVVLVSCARQGDSTIHIRVSLLLKTYVSRCWAGEPVLSGGG